MRKSDRTNMPPIVPYIHSLREAEYTLPRFAQFSLHWLTLPTKSAAAGYEQLERCKWSILIAVIGLRGIMEVSV